MKQILFILLLLTNIINATDYKNLSIEQRFDLITLLASDIDDRDELINLAESISNEMRRDDLTKEEMSYIFKTISFVHSLYKVNALELYDDITEQDLKENHNSVLSIYMRREGKSLNEIIDIAIFEAKHFISLTQMMLFSYLQSDVLPIIMGITDETMNKIVKYTTECSNLGNVRCSYELGEAYYSGYHVQQDKQKGLELMLKGADTFPEAAFSVSVHYFNEGDIAEFLEYSKLASELGSSKASHNMGIWLLDHQENRSKEDEKKAYDYFILASEQDEDNIGNNYDIARCYLYGFGVAHDFQKAKEYSLSVHNSDLVTEEVKASNKRMLGEIYWYIGQEAEENKRYEEAFNAYTKGIELESSDNYYALAKMYFNGQYVKKDTQKVVELYKKASDLGHTDATFWYGYRLFFGDGISKDEINGMKLMTNIANKGHGLALWVTSDIYYHGSETVKKDLKKAKEYLDQAIAYKGVSKDAISTWNKRYPNEARE